jgi:myosin heavy subunit
MSFENFPTGNIPAKKIVSEKSNLTPKRSLNYKSILLGVLIAALAVTWGYVIWDKNKSNEQKQQLSMPLRTSDSSKNDLQRELNEAVMNLDMLKSTNAKAEELLRTKDKDIEDLKQRIQKIINDKKATSSQLAEARRLIKQLKGNIEMYAAEIEKLKNENVTLTEEKRAITEQRDVVRRHFDSATTVISEKEKVIDIGSTLHASNLNVMGIKERNNGKEKETTTAKRVDKLKISFEIDENRIAQSGVKEIFVNIIAPDGSAIVLPEAGAAKFTTRDGVEKMATKKVEIDYKQGERKQVQIELAKAQNFVPGDYKIEIYNNGFKIGEAVRSLKKGGLFS